SQAAPFAAGVGALMLDANPSLVSTGSACPASDTSSDCLDGVYDATMSLPMRNLITSSAVDWGPQGPDNDYGYGRLDAYAAIDAASAATGPGGPSVPTHKFAQGELAGSGSVNAHTLAVTQTNFPIAITMVTPGWTEGGTTDFDVTLLDPSGATVATSFYKNKRQETLGYLPTTTGNYTVQVTSVQGSGTYWLDASFPGDVVAPPPPPAPPATPATFTASGASTSQINLAWSDVSGEDGYRLLRATSTSGPWTSVTSLAANRTSFSDTGLATGTTYYYRLAAFNAGGESAPASASAKTTSDTVAPTAPKSLKGTGGRSKITLSWMASTDSGGSGLAGYKVFKATASAGPWTQIATTTALTYEDTAVTKGKVFYYHVVAYDKAGNTSAKSNVVNAKST
ncbi:MAG TPA: fibronectin type III domain-containing protein, partial [Actinomycetota bacterium]